MKKPPETFKFAEALFLDAGVDGPASRLRNRAELAGDIFAARSKVQRNKEGAAQTTLTGGFELTAAFFERGDEPQAWMGLSSTASNCLP